MSTFKISGTLAYAKIHEPGLKYQKVDKYEYAIDVIVDEDTADEWSERFKKQPAKTVKTSEFKDKYRIDPVYPDEKKQYVITLRRDTHYPDGNPMPENLRPRVYVKNEEGALEDVTFTKVIGNGSKGTVSYQIDNGNYGEIVRLRNVLVEDFIEYVAKASTSISQSPENDFADVAPAAPASPKAAVAKASTKPSKAVVEKVEEEDEDLPF